ncbi:hypothetical protein K4L06_17590 [Lysobacter sp. BMK333-48F3]|uniref:hypothetical protein n=1 Tax=Lysobacter sp. BMK333-48F3 TaxID=2867962 RepID=UPI001C8CEE43|nr:hypothetical protein [Lysobacter sp. BMK333-48F3]MBX9403125.1 hypothetical protein [Lysobacter sp. BMK333-48F3]
MKRLIECLSLSIVLLLPAVAAAQFYEKDNGVIRVRLNEKVPPLIGHSPMITSLWIAGRQAVPNDNVGAGFQMTTRSYKGNEYNPTQGGDCTGRPSLLTGVIPDWNGAQLGTPASRGILLGIDPLLYDEPGLSGSCSGGKPNPAPYDMAFGVTLGDGIAMPREAMIVDMSIRKDHPDADHLFKALSELPVAYVDADFLRYAYYSVDGVHFQRLNVDSSHDLKQWPWNVNHHRSGHAIALCDRPDMVEQPSQGTCMAFYSHEPTLLTASRRQGAPSELGLMTTLGDDDFGTQIVDTQWHTARRLVAVGHLTSVAAVIAYAEQHIPASSWGQW